MTHKPISTQKWLRFLKCLNIDMIRQGKGDHTIFNRSIHPLIRSIPVRLNYAEIPALHIKTSLFTIRQSGVQNAEIERCAIKARLGHLLS